MSFFVELSDRQGNFLISAGPYVLADALAVSAECAADGMYAKIWVELEE